MIAEKDFKRLLWASRRGMLELDLLLVPYVEQRFMSSSAEDQQRFIKLVEGEDNDLFAWLLGRGEPQDPDLAIIVKKIIAFARKE